MKDNDISTVKPNEALPADNIPACKKCGAKWESGSNICPWCGANKAGEQILPLKFQFPKIETKDSKWEKTRPVQMPKAMIILLASIIVGAALYYLLPIIFAFSMVLNMVILVLIIYSAASVGIYFGISAIFKRLINVWAKGNSSWLTGVTSVIIFLPSAIRITVTFWSVGAVAGIMSLIMGLVLPILGFAGIAIYFAQVGSGKFCPYCDSNLFLRKDVVKIHSCNTERLITHIDKNEPKNTFTDLSTPEASNHAFTAVDLCLCKKEGCRHAQITIHQHMMYLTYNKQNNQWQQNDTNQIISEHEISGEIFDSWTESWSKKDPLA